MYPSTQLPVPWFLSLWLCSNSWQWHFCYFQHSTQQNTEWALDIDCKFWSGKFLLQILLDVKITVSSNSLESKRRQHNCSPTSVLVVSSQLLQPFNSFKLCWEEITGIQNYNLLGFTSNNMYFVNNFIVNVQSIRGICSNSYSLISFLKFRTNFYTQNRA